MNSRKKIVLLIVVCFQLLVAFRTKHTLIRDIGYVTRPLWGKNNDFANVKWIPHFRGMNMCESHNWQARHGNEPLVYDVFMFSSELDILDIRLRELWDVVDFFVLVESRTYYSGEPKPAYFAQNSDRYKWASSKLRPFLHNGSHFAGNIWTNEGIIRSATGDALSKLNPPKDSIILVADVDEIPFKETVSMFRKCEGYPDRVQLDMRGYIYSFAYRTDTTRRASVNTYSQKTLYYSHFTDVPPTLADAGWHCSFCFRYISDYINKMKNYSHRDRVTNPKYQLDPSVIQEKICAGIDVFDMYPEAYSFSELFRKIGPYKQSASVMGLPAYLLNNPRRYSFLLPGGCKREPERATTVKSTL